MPPLDILGTFQDPLNLDQGASKLVNVRVVKRQHSAVASGGAATSDESKPSKVRLVGSPGLDVVCKPTSAPCISLCHALNTIWSGHGDGSIWHGVETGTPTLAGFVAVGAQPIIRMAEDRTALVITSNRNVINTALFGTAYTAKPGVGVVNSGFDASIQFDPSTCVELDNFAIYGAASNVYANQSDRMYRSVPLDPANVGPLFFATKEARADRIVDLAISGRVLWPLGARSLEQWYNSGADPADTDFPFQAFPNSMIDVGIASRTSLAVLRSKIVFVATDRRIWGCTGQSGQGISPAWVDLLLQQLTLAQVGQLTAYAYGQGGSDFYVLTLPGQWTLELAGSTGVWSYRKSFGRNDHAGRCATEHDGGTTYVGLDTGEICTVDLNSSSEPAGTLERSIITPWVGSEEQRATFSALDITSSMGPQAGAFQLDWSEDNNVTVNEAVIAPRVWRGARQIVMPQPGTRRAIGRNFGSGRRRQFRLQYDGTQAPFTIDEMFAYITPGS